MLDLVKASGMKIGLISNCAPEEISAWKASALASYFDDVVFSYAVKLAKPDPAIYQLACSRLQVSPDESVFVGDGGSNELQGAAAVGMLPYQAAWFLPAFRRDRMKEFLKLEQPLALPSLLRSLQSLV